MKKKATKTIKKVKQEFCGLAFKKNKKKIDNEFTDMLNLAQSLGVKNKREYNIMIGAYTAGLRYPKVDYLKEDASGLEKILFKKW